MEDGQQADVTEANRSSTAERKLLRELQVKFEVLRLHLVPTAEGTEALEAQPDTAKLVRQMSMELR